MQPSKYYILIFFLDNLYPSLIVLTWWLVWGKKVNILFIINKISWLWRSYKKNGGIYLGGRGSISTDVFNILENLRINCQMDAGEFKGLWYNTLSEEPFKNQIFDMTDEKDDYTISNYVSQHFGILIGETWTCLTCHAKKSIKIWLIYYVIGRNIT